MGSYQGPTRVLPGSYRAPIGVLPGSYQGPTRVLPESSRGPTRFRRGSDWGPIRVLPGFYRDPTGFQHVFTTRLSQQYSLIILHTFIHIVIHPFTHNWFFTIWFRTSFPSAVNTREPSRLSLGYSSGLEYRPHLLNDTALGTLKRADISRLSAGCGRA